MQLGWALKEDRDLDVLEQQVKNKGKAAKEQVVWSGLWEEVFGHAQLPWGAKEHCLCLGCREENFAIVVVGYPKEA